MESENRRSSSFIAIARGKMDVLLEIIDGSLSLCRYQRVAVRQAMGIRLPRGGANNAGSRQPN
jgi:hypothetical protein